jgi:hypothetical protein
MCIWQRIELFLWVLADMTELLVFTIAIWRRHYFQKKKKKEIKAREVTCLIVWKLLYNLSFMFHISYYLV